MKTSPLADARIAVALAHAEPRCVVELTGPDGRAVRVGRSCRAGCTVSPCAIRQALVETMLTATDGLGSRGSVSDSVRARMLDGPDGPEHVGLGAYRCDPDTGRIAFGLLLRLPTVERCVRETVDELRAGVDELGGALDGCAIRAEYDSGLGTTVVVVEGDGGPDDDGTLELLALRLCAACRVEELLAESGPALPGQPA